MRGEDEQQEVVFSYRGMEQRIPTDHPLRGIRRMTDRALADLSLHFEALYARRGRPSIAPEKLLRALMLLEFTRKSKHQHFGFLRSRMEVSDAKDCEAAVYG